MRHSDLGIPYPITREELLSAAGDGAKDAVAAMIDGRIHEEGGRDVRVQFYDNIHGKIAEWVFSRVAGLPYRRTEDRSPTDVGGYQVKWAPLGNNLLIRPDHLDANRTYVLVTGDVQNPYQVWYVVGWITPAEGRQVGEWITRTRRGELHKNRWHHRVYQRQLHPITELPGITLPSSAGP